MPPNFTPREIPRPAGEARGFGRTPELLRLRKLPPTYSVSGRRCIASVVGMGMGIRIGILFEFLLHALFPLIEVFVENGHHLLHSFFGHYGQLLKYFLSYR